MSSVLPVMEELAVPIEAVTSLAVLREVLGFTPTLALAMAHAPASFANYVTGLGAVGAALSPVEAQLVMLAASRANGAAYGMAIHTLLARRAGADETAIAVAGSGDENDSNARIMALMRITRLMTHRLAIGPADVDGFNAAELVEIAYSVSLKQFANIIAIMSDVAIDETLKQGSNHV